MLPPIKIIFFGTPTFAVPSLEILLKDPRFIVTAVVSQSEKPVGRKQEITKSPVALLAEEKKITTILPSSIKTESFFQWMQDQKPDICVVVAYGKIIPHRILAIPTFGCINIHGSLLPAYRGASPIQFALLNGESKTGITIMTMNDKMDEGDIILQAEEPITPDDTSASLFQKLSSLGAKNLPDTLDQFIQKKIIPTPQIHSQATYTSIITKEMGRIDWNNETAHTICNKLRAFTPWPGIYTFLQGKRIKILEATLTENILSKNIPGTLLLDHTIQTLQGQLIPLCVQPEGKKPMPFIDFLRGMRETTIHFE